MTAPVLMRDVTLVDQPVPVALDTPEQQRAERLRKAEYAVLVRHAFESLRQEIRLSILTWMERMEQIDPTTKAHAQALAALAGIKLHRVNIGQADDKDALAIRDDMVVLSGIVDSLIAERGAELARHFDGVDQKLFSNVLRNATEGNAEFECTVAAERWREDQRTEYDL